MSFTKFSIVILFVFFSTSTGIGQWYNIFGDDKKVEAPKNLLMDRGIQIETTEAINFMYNYQFVQSEREFKWLLVKYPEHPIGYFLIGLNYWWRLVPDTKETKYDASIMYYMDKAIDKADDLYDNDNSNKEAAFFLAAAYAFKGRLYSEREKWTRAAYSGKQAIKYLEASRGDENINPELLFGDGLYNFYSRWIHENYKSLRPILTFFRKGDKQKGIKQLEEVSTNAFYTRMEARYFLVQIYAMENESIKGLKLAEQMHELYPNNSFFHRYAARSAFVLGRMNQAQRYAEELLESIASNKYGYGANDGRYGAYILGYVYKNYRKNDKLAKEYFEKCVSFAQSNDSEESGYYLGSQMALADYAVKAENFEEAIGRYQLVIDDAKSKSSVKEEAKTKLGESKKKARQKKRKLRNG